MARQRDAAEPRDLADDVLRRQPHVGEVEARQDVVVHAEDQHVAVVGLDLGGVQDEEAVPVLQLAEVARRVELAVLGEHDAVERPLVALALEQLQYASTGARLSSERSEWRCRSRIMPLDGTSRASPRG